VAKKADKAKVEKAATANDSSKHPTQHEVTIQMTDGTKFNIKTTWGKPGEVLKLDVDPKNHPAWQENSKSFINVNDDRINKFKKKFGDFGAL
jgi:large subunit ribosomal protein L31